MSELENGLYEALLTNRLRKRLPADASRVLLGRLESAEASTVLADHIARVTAAALRSPGLDGELDAQIQFCNRLIGLLSTGDTRLTDLSDEAVDVQARQLLEVMRESSGLVAPSRTDRPTIPLSQDALLVAARHEPRLAAELYNELMSVQSVDLLCAFVRWSGIRVLMEPLRRLRQLGVRIRVITSTYTGSTELRALQELAAIGAEIKVSYELGSTRLHAKAWLFERSTGFSTAYIGSSNLSHTALHDGLEWNVRLTQASSPELLQRFRAAFETYWADPTFELYNEDIFAKALAHQKRADDDDLLPFEIQAHPFQREMLYQLEVERHRHGRWKNLIVAATGTGKTVVSAFDYRRVRAEFGGQATLLFVAHREEILRQSLSTFRNVLREGNFGEYMVGGMRPQEGRHVFASIQSLAKVDLAQFRPDTYDVVIVDEFHHAEAPTYQRLLDRIRPRLLLGLTATPERADGLDVKRWFDGRIAVELRLWDALDQGLLSPFQYFGVADGTDLTSLSWSRGGYETKELDNLYTANDYRVGKVLKSVDDIVEDPRAMKALGFCVSIKHAEYMAQKFEQAGIPARAVSTDSTREERSLALTALRKGRVNAIFAVDLFNEGLDIPEIDTVFFLRPTESPVVFLQQLGRGLRRAEGKSGLTVLDFIGQQHRSFRYEERFRALIGGDRKAILEQIEEGFPFLPAGCSITLDRQSSEAIIENIKASIPRGRKHFAARLREMGDVGLGDYLDRSLFALNDVYTSTTPGWTVIRREAGFVKEPDPDEWTLEKTLARMLHIDDEERVDAYLHWLGAERPPALGHLSVRQKRLLAMLHFDVWIGDQQGAVDSKTTLPESLERLWKNPNILQELRELLNYLGRRSRHLSPDSGLEPEIPLRLHTRYTRNELLAALGEATPERPTAWREGVRRIERYAMDVLAVTLEKSERRFSPTTRYRDYPVSPTLFHWESQSVTRAASATGQRYIHHDSKGDRVLLFVRETSDGAEGLGAMPFLFLGTAHYLRHEGERPMAITWRLDHEMPPDFFQAAKAAV